IAGRKAPGMAAVGRRVADAPAREVPPEAPRRGRGQVERGRLHAALRRVLRGAREKVRVRLRDGCLRGHRGPHTAGRPRPARPTAASSGRNRFGVPAYFPTGRLETPPRLARSAPRRRDRSGAGTHLLDQARRIGRTLRVGREVPSDVARHPFGPRTIPGREGRGRESEGEETMTRTTGDRERSRLGESATGGLNTLRLESRLESEEEIRMAIPRGPRAGRLTFEGDFATLTFERTLRHPVEAVWEAITDPVEGPTDEGGGSRRLWRRRSSCRRGLAPQGRRRNPGVASERGGPRHRLGLARGLVRSAAGHRCQQRCEP